MTKLLFLTLWYCAVYPGALFMGAFALFINYFVDRFSLMRTWKRQPHLGTSISEVSRRYFFALAIVAMAIMSSYFWASFPFDNLCTTNETVGNTVAGDWIVQPLNGGQPQIVALTSSDQLFQYCLQDFFRFPVDVPHFPFVSKYQPAGLEWMTEPQQTVSNIYGWSSLGVLLAVALSFVWMCIRGFFKMFIRGQYKPTGKDQGINFSDVPSISAYVPQVESSVFSYPLLACRVDNIDDNLLDWTDPDRPYSFYDLTRDAEALLSGTDVSSKVVFSQIVHWPPTKAPKTPPATKSVK